MLRTWPWLLLASACTEYGLWDVKDPVDPTDTETDTETFTFADSGGTTYSTSTAPDPAEECDGIDNDGDSLVDEGYPDSDGDGIADCLDVDCAVELPGGGAVTPLEECQPYDPAAVKDPWNVTLEWSFTLAGSIVVSPVTGQLTDDNGDGLIDDLDIPDVAFTSYTNGSLYIVSGDGSGLICSQAGWRSDGGVIIADVDSDGVNEVVGPTAVGRVRAVDGSCNTEWTSARQYTSLLYPVSTAGDLDGDGDVEVVVDSAVVEGANGAHVAELLPVNPSCWRTPLTGDLDQDGDLEVVLGDSVFDASGARLWSASASGTSCFNALVNLDTDDQAEVIFSYGLQIIAYEHDGTEIWRSGLTVSNPGPPCAGDIDGDGEVEIVAPSGTQLMAFEANGTSKWSQTMSDSSGAAGCAVFDMNSDEIYEVLFADEVALRVYDGTSGAVLYENNTHDSVTYFETPTVADVDNDGSAEMLVVNSPWLGGTQGLTVFGHNGSGWPESGSTWGLHDFSATNQNPDGSIPQTPEAPWLKYNICRGRPYDDYPGLANLVPQVVDVCVSSCDPAVGVVTVSYQVWNDGGADAADTTVSLYLVSGGVETWYSSQVVPAAATGEVQAALTFEVLLADWTGELVIVTDDDGLSGSVVDECHEDDNRSSWVGEVCP